MTGSRTVTACWLVCVGLGVGCLVSIVPDRANAQTALYPTNLALGKPARQSSTYAGGVYGGDASLAVDGNTDGNWADGSVAHTEYEANPWWEVDLGEQRQIGRIEIANRSDCCADRLANFMVIVANFPILDSDITDADTDAYPGVMRTVVQNQTQAMIVVPINRSGRYVRVALLSPNYLNIAEVEVIEANNAARGRPTAQSSTQTGGDSSHAVDGNTSGAFSTGSVAVTQNQQGAWWTVDLGLQHKIREIDIWSANADCCGTHGATLSLNVTISDTPFNGPPLASPTGHTYVVAHQGSPAVLPLNLSGRYVGITTSATDALSLSEVQVWTMARGSLGAHVNASNFNPPFFPAGMEKPIDLDTSTSNLNYYDSYVAGDQPFYELDLGAHRYIETVRVWDVPLDTTLQTFYLFASDKDFVDSSGNRITQIQTLLNTPGVSSWVGRGVDPVTAISIMRQARYLRIQVPGTANIKLAELELVTTEGIAIPTLSTSPLAWRVNGSIDGSGTLNANPVQPVSTSSRTLNLTGYFPRPGVRINAYAFYPSSGSGPGSYQLFGTATTGTTPVLTPYGAAPMYAFSSGNVVFPGDDWLQGGVAGMMLSADDNYGFTPTPLRGIDGATSEHMFWPDIRVVSTTPTPDDQISNGSTVGPPTNSPYLDLPMGTTPVSGYPSPLLPAGWLDYWNQYFLPYGGQSIGASYFNAGDLGIGRDMHCVHSGGARSCYVDNYAALDANHRPIFGDPYGAASSFSYPNRLATVVMLLPDVGDGSSPNYPRPAFAAYDHNTNRLGSIALDSTGARTGIPNNCMTCHGGSGRGVDGRGNTIVDRAFFLPFDLDSLQDLGSNIVKLQAENFRKLNAFVRDTEYNGAIRDLIDGWYHGNVYTAGQPFDGSYVPKGWSYSLGESKVYKEVVKPYCRTCHIAQERDKGGLDFVNAPDVENLRALIIGNACVIHRMPHAQQTLRRFWQSGARAQLLGFYGRNDLVAACNR